MQIIKQTHMSPALWHIMLLHDVYFAKLNQPVYRLETCLLRPSRVVTGGTRYTILFCEVCDDFPRVEEMMRENYIHRPDVGERYYYGNASDMIVDIETINRTSQNDLKLISYT